MEPDAQPQDTPITSVNASIWDFLLHDVPVPFFSITAAAVVVSLVSITVTHDVTIPIAIAILASIALRILKKRVEAKFMEQFAARNGLSYQASGLPRVQTGRILTIGHDAKTTSLISGSLSNLNYQLFLFTTTIGSGKYQHEQTNTVMEVSLGHNTPNLFASSLKPNSTKIIKRLDFTEELPSTGSSHTLNLEGNFNDYYRIELVEGDDLEALQIFEPNLMANLIDTPYRYDFELLDQTLFIYSPGHISSQDQLDSFYKFAGLIGNAVQHEVATMHIPSAVVAPSPKRTTHLIYNTSVVITVVFMTVGLFGLLLALLSSGSGPELQTQASFSGLILIVGCFCLVITQSFKH